MICSALKKKKKLHVLMLVLALYKQETPTTK